MYIILYTHLHLQVVTMRKITQTYLAGLKATGELQNISCNEGLVLRITAKGKKGWFLRYDTITQEGKRKQNIVSIGEFAALSLKEARVKADELKEFSRAQNTNLAQVKKEEKLNRAQIEHISTFQELAEAWLDLKTPEWGECSAKQNRGRLTANVFPVIGDIPVSEVTVADVERALKFIIDRGSLEVARRVHTLVVSIFKYALSRQVIDQPDIIMRLAWYKESMPKHKTKSLYAEELSPDEIGQLLLAIYENRFRWTPPVAHALQLAPYCTVRPSELLGAQWDEINLKTGEWVIPGERMKMGLPHLVPLPRQAIELFKSMYAFSGNQPLVFPSTSSRLQGKPVSSMALIQAFRRMGYSAEGDNRFVTHAFRGMFSTIAYNTLGAPPLLVELQLAHSERNKVRAAYHKTSLRTALDERRQLLQKYADYLDSLRSEATKRGKCL